MITDADRRLVDRWIATWLSIRAVTSSDVDGWPLVHVGSPSRETELICVEPGAEDFAALVAHIAGDHRAMLTVVGRDVAAYLTAPLPPGVRVDRDDETLMSASLADVPAPPLTSGLRSRWDVDDHRATLILETADAVAASGSVGVLGDAATFDAVETTTAFQRRGLGRHVMAALTTHAVERGATQGVLAASIQGRALYTVLGWQPRLAMLSFMGA